MIHLDEHFNFNISQGNGESLVTKKGKGAIAASSQICSNKVRHHEVDEQEFFGGLGDQMLDIDIRAGSAGATGNSGPLGGIFQRVPFKFVRHRLSSTGLGEGEADTFGCIGHPCDLMSHSHLSLLFDSSSSLSSWSSHARYFAGL